MNEPTNDPEVQQETEPKPRQPRAQPKAMTQANPLANWFAGIFFMLFLAGVLLWTASLTLGVIDIVLPNSPVVKYFALALFDGGAFVWAGVYIYRAKGTPQRGMSLLMVAVDLLGVIAMVIGAVYLSGQSIAQNPAGIGSAMINGVIVATLANLLAGYYYHLNDPDSRVKIALQNFNDMIFEESLRQAHADVRANARKHGAIMALGLVAQYKYDLGLPMTKAERAALTEDTIDVQAVDVPELPYPAPRALPAWWIAVLKALGRYTPVNVPNPTAPSLNDGTDFTDTPNQDNG
jgi:hypothetical protein